MPLNINRIILFVSVEMYNAQMRLKGCEEGGYVIVSMAKASLLTTEHDPQLLGQSMKSKSSVMGAFDGVQYFATLSAPNSDVSRDEPVAWLSQRHVEQAEKESFMGVFLCKT